MRRPAYVVVVSMLLLAACAGQPADTGESAGSTTTAASMAADTSMTTIVETTSTVAPATPVPAESSTTSSTQAASTEPRLLVAAADGIYFVGPDIDAMQLVLGRAARVVTDGSGGLLYQIDSGRNWLGSDSWVTTIWWLPAGETSPIDLLVPSAGHDLTVVAATDIDGHFTVVYVRSEGEIDAAIDRLRSYDTETHEIRDLFVAGAWEAGFGRIHVSGDVIAMTVFGQIDSECEFIDLQGHPVVVPGDPSAGDATIDDDEGGPTSCVLDPTTDTLAYVDESRSAVVLVDTATGSERGRLALAESIRPTDLDVADGWILVNQSFDDLRPAVLLSADEPGWAWTCPLAGWATLTWGDFDAVASAP